MSTLSTLRKRKMAKKKKIPKTIRRCQKPHSCSVFFFVGTLRTELSLLMFSSSGGNEAERGFPWRWSAKEDSGKQSKVLENKLHCACWPSFCCFVCLNSQMASYFIPDQPEIWNYTAARAKKSRFL